jgi:Protein of unknown function (DUF1553)/Protein of unknown function (DUF1549)
VRSQGCQHGAHVKGLDHIIAIALRKDDHRVVDTFVLKDVLGFPADHDGTLQIAELVQFVVELAVEHIPLPFHPFLIAPILPTGYANTLCEGSVRFSIPRTEDTHHPVVPITGTAPRDDWTTHKSNACQEVPLVPRYLPTVLGAFLVCNPGLAAGPQTERASDGGTPRFSRHVTALFSRLGCNGGTCHGAVQGRGGFRLTLFGADPALDHERLRREYGGRRLNLSDPDASLILLKATARIPHEGGKRMEAGSREYQILRRWIADGAALDSIEKSRVSRLRVTPAEQTARPGASFPLRAEATFADGSTEDVTSLCSFESLDQAVATIDRDGKVLTRGVGDTALIVRYRAEPVMALVMVPRPSTEAFPTVAGHNFIDTHILAKLKRLNIPPSPLAGDATFLRRVSLDVTGELPSPQEVRAFLSDRSPDRRARKIEELLKRPGHAALWTLKFCDLLKASNYGVYADAISEAADAPRFQQWVRARLEENLPYDQFAERILTATSREGRSLEEWSKEVAALFEGYTTPRTDLAVYSRRRTLDLYWQRQRATGVPGALQVAHAFLGLRLECAQCHRHPHDVWQQDDLLSFANFFMRVRPSGFKGDNEKKFPEVAAYFKKFNAEAKKLAAEVKKLKDTRGKQLDAEAKKARAASTKVKAEIARLEKQGDKLTPADRARLAEQQKLLEQYDKAQREYDRFREDIGTLERRAKMLPEIARRMMQAEIQHLSDATPHHATVTSPLGTQSSKTYRLLGESKVIDIPREKDPRLVLAAWLRRPDNPFFARAIVNRVWAHYFGRGIVDPPDNLSPFNPASHPELLDELCRQFIKNGYDLKWLHRTILASRTYQQSSQPVPANVMDRGNYAYFSYRRLPAEVLLDALNRATGTSEKMDMKYYHWPEQMRVVEIPFRPRNDFVNFMLEQFGQPARNPAAQCDCERDPGVSILQVLSLANHPHVWQKITDPKGQVARIVKECKDDTARVEEVFLCTLSRKPSDGERAACLKYIEKAGTPEKGLQGVLWSLLNTREFLLQH